MIKRYKYTFCTLFFSMVFMVCSMVGMDFIIKTRESQLLSETGEVEIELPVRAWSEWENKTENEIQKSLDNEGYLLSNAQIKNAVKSWNERIGETMHNPVEGQISMEDALRIGEEWLAKMNMKEEVAESADTETNFIKATLSVGKQNKSSKVLLEPYYSFWTVNFSSPTLNAVLYINAVTGKVWGAEVVLYGSMHEEPYENLCLFAELAGLHFSDENAIKIDDSKTEAILTLDESGLYVKQQYYSFSSESGITDVQENEGGNGYKNIVVRYNLITE